MGSFAISTTSTNDITGRIEWSESNVSIANNTSDLNVKLIYRMNNSYYTTYGSGYFKITVNGTAYSNDHYVSFASGTHEYTVIDHTFTITHNADGSKSVSIVLNNGYVAGTTGLSASSGSGTATLTTIARASQPSTTNGTFGSAITINTNRASSSFTHTLTMTMGSHSETKTGVGASLSWTIPASWADTIPTATSNTLSISCVTYNGSTNIGTKTTSCTATIPDSWKPTVSISKTLTNAGTNSAILVSVTTITLTASGTASTGTTISSYSWSGGTVSGTGASKAHSPTTAGTFTYTVTVTDGRGRTGTASTTAKAISGVSEFSCNSSVNFGSSLAVTISRKKASFKHSVTWQISSSYTNTETDQETSASYTIPASWAASCPTTASASMTVTVTTYNGSTSLGSKSKTVTVVVPSEWLPDFTLTAEAVSAFNSLYLKGISKVKLTASSATASTGSQIQSYQFSGNNVSKTATSTAASYNVTSDILGTVGSNTYTVKVTDKRGRVKTKTTTVTVTDYKAPTLKLTVGRYDSGGVADSFGAYGRMLAKGTWSNVSGNSWSLTLKQKKKTASSYTTVNSWTNQTTGINTNSSLFAADIDSAYDCQAILTDAVGKSVTVTVALSTARAIIDLFMDKVVTFFSTASESIRQTLGNASSLLFANAERTYINGSIYIPERLSVDGLTGGWVKLNDGYVRHYVFSSSQSLTAQIDALPWGAWSGYVEATTEERRTATGMPEVSAYAISCYKYSANNVVIHADAIQTQKRYTISKINGTWSSWIQEPTRSEIIKSYTTTSGSNYTVATSNSININRPSSLVGKDVIAITAYVWTSNTGAFSLIPYNSGNKDKDYIVGESGTTINGLQVTYWYL